MVEAILDRFFPDQRPPATVRPTVGDLSAYAGTYLANNYCRSCPGGSEAAQRFAVTVSVDGSLALWGDAWREVEPLLFTNASGRRQIGFMRDSNGVIVAVSGGAWRVLKRTPAGIMATP